MCKEYETLNLLLPILILILILIILILIILSSDARSLSYNI